MLTTINILNNIIDYVKSAFSAVGIIVINSV